MNLTNQDLIVLVIVALCSAALGAGVTLFVAKEGPQGPQGPPGPQAESGGVSLDDAMALADKAIEQADDAVAVADKIDARISQIEDAIGSVQEFDDEYQQIKGVVDEICSRAASFCPSG